LFLRCGPPQHKARPLGASKMEAMQVATACADGAIAALAACDYVEGR